MRLPIYQFGPALPDSRDAAHSNHGHHITSSRVGQEIAIYI